MLPTRRVPHWGRRRQRRQFHRYGGPRRRVSQLTQAASASLSIIAVGVSAEVIPAPSIVCIVRDGRKRHAGQAPSDMLACQPPSSTDLSRLRIALPAMVPFRLGHQHANAAAVVPPLLVTLTRSCEGGSSDSATSAPAPDTVASASGLPDGRQADPMPAPSSSASSRHRPDRPGHGRHSIHLRFVIKNHNSPMARRSGWPAPHMVRRIAVIERCDPLADGGRRVRHRTQDKSTCASRAPSQLSTDLPRSTGTPYQARPARQGLQSLLPSSAA